MLLANALPLTNVSLWRNDNGQITDWLGTLAGGFADNYVNTAELLPTNWHVQTDLFQ